MIANRSQPMGGVATSRDGIPLAFEGARRGDAEPGVRPRVVVRPRLLGWPGGPIGGAVPDGGRRSRRSWGVGVGPGPWPPSRLDEWAKAGVFERLQALLLDELGEAGRIDLERCMATKRMTIVAAEPTCATAASGPASLGA